VAVQKTNRRTDQKADSRGSQAVVIFWLVFVIIIISVFMANAETIKENFNLLKTRLTTSPGAPAEPSGTEIAPLAEDEMPDEPVVQEPLPVTPAVREPAQRLEPVTTEPAARPQPPVSERPAPQTPQPVQTRDRNIYFTQIDRDGQILRSRVTRKLPVSDSPMMDVLNIMLIGPSADELNRGIINLIPKNTRILSASVRGNTAYINFSEDFMFNTFGVEGYIAQLRQIVWTVTEFPNVNDVQILVEGRRMDYLGEGIWIGSPISRQSF